MHEVRTALSLVRTLNSALFVAGLVLWAAAAGAQTVVVGHGTIAPSWDGSLTGLTLFGDGTQLAMEFYNGSPTSGLRVGDVADLSTTIKSAATHPLTEQINGTTYSSVWVRAQLRLSATPFTVPAFPSGASFNSLSAPFTLQGEFEGFTDAAMTNQVFAVSVRGIGVAEFGWNTFQSETYVARGGGGTIYRLIWPVEFPFAYGSVGAVGMSGSAGTTEGGELYVGGSGADIWGTTDSFGFAWRRLEGDGEVSARITGESNTHRYAKAGLMIRTSASDPSSAHVLISVKPNHEVEFLTRSTSGGTTAYLGGAQVDSTAVWLKLKRAGDQVTGFASSDGLTWTTVGTATFSSGSAAAGFAVTSHDNTALNEARFANWKVTDVPDAQGVNLLAHPGFEEYTPPAFAGNGAGWIADTDRQVLAKSETNQPHSGAQNGACWSPEPRDCGLYQDVQARLSGAHTLTLYANADNGGWVGVNVNGAGVVSFPVESRGFGTYGTSYTLTFNASAGDTIRVWMYKPQTPGWVVIDDVVLTAAAP